MTTEQDLKEAFNYLVDLSDQACRDLRAEKENKLLDALIEILMKELPRTI